MSNLRTAAKFARYKTAAWTKLGFIPGGQPPAGAAPAPAPAPAPALAPAGAAPAPAPPAGGAPAPEGAPPEPGPVSLEQIAAMLDKFYDDAMTKLDQAGSGGKKKKPSVDERIAKIEQAMGIPQEPEAGGEGAAAPGAPPSPAPEPAPASPEPAPEPAPAPAGGGAA